MLIKRRKKSEKLDGASMQPSSNGAEGNDEGNDGLESGDGEAVLSLGAPDTLDIPESVAPIAPVTPSTPVASSTQSTQRDKEGLRRWPRLPFPKDARATYEQMIDYLSKFTPLQWSHCLIYVYRLWPVVNNQLIEVDAKKYADVISEPEDIKRHNLIARHGGGKYQFLVHDTDYRQKSCQFQCILDIPQHEADPLIDFRALVIGHRGNQSYEQYLRAKGVLDEMGNVRELDATLPMKPGPEGPAVQVLGKIVELLLADKRSERSSGGKGDQDALQRSLSMLETTYKQALETAVRRDSKDDIDKLSSLLNIINQMKSDKPDKSESLSLVQQLITMQSNAHKEQMILMEKLLEARKGEGGAGGNSIDQFDKLLTIGTKMAELMGSAGGGSRKWYEIAADVLPRVITPVENIIAHIIRARAMGLGSTATMIPTSPTTVMESPRAIPATNPTSTASVPTTDEVAIAYIRQYGGFILNALNQGQHGADFADHVVGLFGVQAHAAVSNLGADKILAAAKTVPEFWQAIAPVEKQFAQFVQDFVGYPDTLPEEEETTRVGETVQ